MARRLAVVVVLLAMTVVDCLAQGRVTTRGFSRPVPSPPPAVSPIGHGFGNVVFPGTGIPNPVYQNPTTFAQRFGATISGYPGYMLGGGQPGPGRRGRAGAALVPYAVPVMVGGYGFGYGSAEPAAPQNITIVNSPPSQPSVIINQTFTQDRANPVMSGYAGESLPEPAGTRSYQAPIPENPEGKPIPAARQPDPDKPTIYLVAFKDGSVYSAYAYWVEGDTLHYITTRHSHNKASVGLIDVDLSEQLNAERGVEFTVPSRK